MPTSNLPDALIDHRLKALETTMRDHENRLRTVERSVVYWAGVISVGGVVLNALIAVFVK